MSESLEKRLMSYSVGELRQFVSERNIKNYWKGDMSTKQAIVSEMMMRKEIYDDIPMKTMKARAKAMPKEEKPKPKRLIIKGEAPKKGKLRIVGEKKVIKPKKKERSAKQKANDKRLGEMAKKRAKEKREKK